MILVDIETARKIDDFENREWEKFLLYHFYGLKDASDYYRIRHSAVVDLMQELGLSGLVNNECDVK